jgi:alkanesulfonate monooxygenase SsuD/methylene tetrahydromethanopterin reductase-like flavin-dependent oxidoreductase (luciferase family)
MEGDWIMRFSVWPVAPQPWADMLALGRPGERVDRFAEGLAVLGSPLNKRRTSFAEQYYQLSAAERGPKHVQSPLPLLIGAAPSRMLHRHRADRPSMER